jgi:dolichol-phosphate mannosyltransferase
MANEARSKRARRRGVALSVVVPVYKEEANIKPFLDRLLPVLRGLKAGYEVIFCLDPSPDGTEAAIQRAMQEDPAIRLLVFSRRFGQPAATMAGLHQASGEAAVVIDVDLQDQPELIAEMFRLWKDEGWDVVYARRRSRKGETLVKRLVAHFGYRLIHAITEVRIPQDTGDFRLLGPRPLAALRSLKETNGFLRGLVAYVGFRQYELLYDRDERAHGPGNYNRFLGSLKIGINGVVGFSSRPLQMASILGFLVSFTSFLLGIWYVIQKWVLHFDLTPGLPTTVVVVTFLAGVQLLSLGILGEYVGRIYDEVKGRPAYIVERDLRRGPKRMKRAKP